MIFCVLGIILVPVLLFKEDEHRVVFWCPKNDSDTKGDIWPLPDYERVVCVFSPLHLLQKIWVVYQFLLCLAVVCLLINFIRLIKWHTIELGFECSAQFSFETGMPYHYYHPQIWRKVIVKNICFCACLRQQKGCSNRGTCKRFLSLVLYPFSPFNIRSDYDFLMVKLFRTDGGLGYIMKEVHIMRLE